MWPEISDNFSHGTKTFIGEKTIELLSKMEGWVKGYKDEGIIGRALYEAAKEVYKLKRVNKPKTQEEIANMMGVSARTISRRQI